MPKLNIMSEKMRAMVLSKLGPVESNPLKLTEIDRHEITNPKEVLVKIEACGVCHSQLHSIEGDWKDLGIPPTLPTVPGHEVVGKIVEVGSNVTKFRVGERVGITPLLGSCLDCQYCNEGKEYLCEKMDVTGESLKGGYTEYITVSEDFATKVPDTMKPEYAAPLFCAGITAYKAVKAAEPEKNKKIALVRNKNLSFLTDFKMPEVQKVISNHNLKIKGWKYLCNYKNNISNIKMNINLFYKFTKNKPKKFTWYSIDGSNVEFIPSFTKKIFKKVKKLYV